MRQTKEDRQLARVETQNRQEATAFKERILAERALLLVGTTVGFPEGRQNDHLHYALDSLLRDRGALVLKMASLVEDLTRDADRLTKSVGQTEVCSPPLNSSYARDV